MKQKSADRILLCIKMKGEATLALIASDLGITKEGVRQHLVKLSEDGLINTLNKSDGVGRPTTYYFLTDKALARFPDSHAQLTVDLLRSVKNLLGENALDLLIGDREKQTYSRYENELATCKNIQQKLERLTALRTEEGYMAEWKESDGDWYLTENHCPICAAATECQGFCRAELRNFKQLLGNGYEVTRVQHIITDGTKCVYKIRATDF
ncbi:transcriptional regulator [Niastella yeongjuensis]|uniref:Transcriptional regulator n=1 Tax=Niastella yeongjuensis TaxID=354355 RepID=A0A1V9E9E9_9BACT|nr:metalloregulator ArsR/SmtB family transcription factor [Niastella yeongjuensis]OQP42758.1 transcriptional regulator [Niastella yeongjuensis]SEO52667.1 Predicted transcriptional regulator, ArsR family [Niastella yeongjuensis]